MLKKALIGIFIVLILGILLQKNSQTTENIPVDIASLPQMPPVEKFSMYGDTGSGFVIELNGKKFSDATFSKELIAKLEKCQKYQQSDFEGYILYQVWGLQDGKCLYKELSNSGMMGSKTTSWTAQKTCSFDPDQLKEFVKAMKDPKGMVEERTYKTQYYTTKVTSPYYNYLLEKYINDGVCKLPF